VGNGPEFFRELEEATAELREPAVRRVYGLLDTTTKLLARVPDAAIAAAPFEANCEMVRRLENELARYVAHTS
jgi:hypothetical protein